MSDITETTTVQDGQAAVRTVTVSGQLKPAASATDVITLVKTADGDQAAVKVVSLGGGGGGSSEEVESLSNAVSVLHTSVDLAEDIGSTTVVMLDELVAMDIDGRPSHKEPGATVYADNAVQGIISTVDKTAGTADIVTVSVSGVDALVIEEY